MNLINQLINDTPKFAYSTRQGGEWIEFETKYPVSHVEKEVTSPRNWGRFKGPHPEQGDRNYLTSFFIPPYHPVKIHSLRFPDGRVWSSSTRDFEK